MISIKEICKSGVDLVIDGIYEGGNSSNISDGVLTKLMSVQNSGGFRFKNTLTSKEKAYYSFIHIQ